VIRRSLHVGLNYPGTDAELSGCINDALDWYQFFGTRGYEPFLIREPTKVQILDALRTRLGGLRRGDRFVFTYSGHGSWIPDRDGDEADGRDEVLCPADFQARITPTTGVLTDDELYAVMQGASFGVRRTIISDSCHSGTVQRFAGVEQHPSGFATWEGRVAVPRFMPPAMFLSGAQVDTAEALVRRRLPPNGPSRSGAVLISGCDDTEYSYDAWFGQRANGAFTHNAIDSYREGMTMAAWHRAIRERLPSTSYQQSPQLQSKVWQRWFRL
jgi:hypothetical protein